MGYWENQARDIFGNYIDPRNSDQWGAMVMTPPTPKAKAIPQGMNSISAGGGFVNPTLNQSQYTKQMADSIIAMDQANKAVQRAKTASRSTSRKTASKTGGSVTDFVYFAVR